MKRKWFRRIFMFALSMFILMNIVAFLHARGFTHFDTEPLERTAKPENLSFLDKVGVLISGVNNPRPINDVFPSSNYETIVLDDQAQTEAWFIPIDRSKGSVIICHGYGGCKSKMLDRAQAFNEMGYNTFLIDFMGSGGSNGNITSIGYYESSQILSSIEYLQNRGEENIFLFGSSMGSSAILKAFEDGEPDVKGILIECPFASLDETVSSRFRIMDLPSFPMADLLVFWGGVQLGFWGFEYQPSEYAKKVKVPSLLMIGMKDEKVSMGETKTIFSNLNGEKFQVAFENTGHENYLSKNGEEWKKPVKKFLLHCREIEYFDIQD